MSFMKLGAVSALAMVMATGGALAKSDIVVAMQLEPPHLDPTGVPRGRSTVCFIPTCSRG